MGDNNQHLLCPVCSEPVKAHWRFCPACETRLKDLQCPQCHQAVKENWKRCPECETLLVCLQCGRRLNSSNQGCLDCTTLEPAADGFAAEFLEQVCGMEMIYVAGGSFQMGDTFGQGADNENPTHPVSLSGFYMARHTVTQSQWLKLMAENPSPFQGDGLPVVQVTHEQVNRFARLLSQAHDGRYLFGLPSEAQWEFAARSGGRQELYAGSGDINEVAWYEENSGGRPHPVGSKSPNSLGLYDMSGNVWEWCRDSFVADAYTRHAARDPVIEEGGSDKVIRGGSWHLDAWSARCTRRLGFAADFTGPALGFRLAMTVMG